MEYIGEHLLPGNLGRLFVCVSFAAAVSAALAYYLFIKKGDAAYKKLARALFTTHAISVLGIVVTLLFLLTSHYYEYDYVWKHSSNDLPLRYILSAFWEGQEGSFILWMFWHAVLGCVLLLTAKRWEAPAMIVFALVQAFLSSMILGIFPFALKIGSSPFVLMRETAENVNLPWTEIADYLQKFPNFMDGTGLNPLLQNYWMTIHPPVLFLGFASTLVPFAFALSALFVKDFKGWLKPALPWTFFSIMILGVGILMGGAWAYEALSFGGFWAWDPVENSSLVPWIIIVAAGHLMLVSKNRGTAIGTTFFLSLSSFLLVLYSTFLTRSGVLGDTSVHAFVGLGLSGQLLIYLLFFVLIAYGVFIFRFKKLPKSKGDDDLSSREFWMFIGGLILLISAFQITFSTSIPVINQLIGPEGVIALMDTEMAPPLDAISHYNSFQIPFTIIICLLVAIGQFLQYRATGTKSFLKRIGLSFIVSLALSTLIAFYFYFYKEPLYFLLLFTGTFAVISNLHFWLRIGKGKLTFAGSSVAHIGFALLIVGALISQARQSIISESEVFLGNDFPQKENALLDLADTVRLGNYQVIFNGMRQEGGKQFYDVDYYRKKQDGSLDFDFQLRPFLQMSDQMGPTPNPDTRHYWNQDIYTHVTYSSYLNPTTTDGYANEMEAEILRGDTVLYQQHFIIADSLEVHAIQHEENGEIHTLKLTTKLRIVNVLGEEAIASPSYILEGDEVSYEEVELEKQGFKFRFSDINLENNKLKITAWTQVDPDEKPFIIMKAIVFPYINVLWIGCILMAIGTMIAVWQRIKSSKD